MNELVVVGAGGHGRELFTAIIASNAVSPTWNVKGFVDDDPSHPERVERIGSRVLGGVDWLESRLGGPGAPHYALGIGTSVVRRTLSDRLDALGGRAATILHPNAFIGSDVKIGEGVVIYERSSITTNVQIGDHTHLNVGCVVQHDSVVGEFVQFSPGVFVNGDCTIGDDVFLGTGAIVTRGCEIGTGARVGAGAVVLDDIAAGTTVVGVPARPR